MSEWLEDLWYPRSRLPIVERIALSPLTAASWVFRGVVSLRNAAYRYQLLPVRSVSGTRTVSVGNLNVGGAGKTPVVIYLTQLCLDRGKRVAVVSRGYGRLSSQEVVLTSGGQYSAQLVGDEPLLISRRCPGATVFVGSDRVRMAERAHNEAGAEIVLVDDGLQHRRLKRDFEVVVIDQEAGFGNGQLLPRGPLREPISALRRADLLWLRQSAGNPISNLPSLPRVRAIHSVRTLLAPDGGAHPVVALSGKKAFVFAAVARPRALVQSLRRVGLSVQGSRFFADHHFFQPRELEEIQTEAKLAGADFLATTEKDRVRLPDDFPAWTLRLDVEVVEGMPLLRDALGLD